MAETFLFRGSSNLTEATYDADTETLHIVFSDGSEYDYYNVPQQTYRSLTLSGSAGSFFHRQIKQRYAYDRS